MGDITSKSRRHYSGLAADMADIIGQSILDVFLTTDTKIVYFWDGVAWTIIPLDVIVAGMLKTDSVEEAKINADAVVTAKIKDLNVTKAKAELGFGRFVPRATDNVDFEVGTPFILDGNWYVNQLDTSGIVPAGAIAVKFKLYMRATAASVGGYIRRRANSQASMIGITQVANVFLPVLIQDVLCDADRLFDCRFFANIDFLQVTVLGWYI